MKTNRSSAVTQEWPHGDKGEKTVNDGRDASQDFQQWLCNGSNRPSSIFRHIDSSEQANRNSHQKGNHGDIERAPDEGEQAKGAFPATFTACRTETWIPGGAKEEVQRVDLAEEVNGLKQHGKDNADCRQNSDGRCKDQSHLDVTFHQISGTQAWLDSSIGQDEAKCQKNNNSRYQYDIDEVTGFIEAIGGRNHPIYSHFQRGPRHIWPVSDALQQGQPAIACAHHRKSSNSPWATLETTPCIRSRRVSSVSYCSLSVQMAGVSAFFSPSMRDIARSQASV